VITVLIADDHPVIRFAVATKLGQESGLDVVAEAADLRATYAALKEHRPNVLLLDLHLPEPVLPAIPSLRDAAPETAILVLTADADPTRARAALAAGAAGYVLKDRPLEELVQAIRTVAAGGRHLHPDFAVQLIGIPEPSDPPGGLSPREVDVLKLLAEGHTNREVAERLYLSVRTVESHRARIQLKLNRSSRAELVAYAELHGLSRLHLP
jgi:two-component system, NarL family, response regulator NreC